MQTVEHHQVGEGYEKVNDSQLPILGIIAGDGKPGYYMPMSSIASLIFHIS